MLSTMGLVHPKVLSFHAVVDVMDIAREKEKIVISPDKSRCVHLL